MVAVKTRNADSFWVKGYGSIIILYTFPCTWNIEQFYIISRQALNYNSESWKLINYLYLRYAGAIKRLLTGIFLLDSC